ncbi:hypothetical protein WDH52_19425 [Streptomyces sp. TRM70308]|uniref:hypothetical protein n=1 Tax=Streptomyces sp. TRM70308 TaxID=3131932 RepID=UPI003D08BC0D
MHDLDAAVLLLLEDFVTVRGLFERQRVRGEVLGAQRIAVTGHRRHDLVDPTLDVGLTHADRHALVERVQHGEGVGLAAVHADHRDRARPAHRGERRAQRSHAVDARLVQRFPGHRAGQPAGGPLSELLERCAMRLHADGVDDPVGPAPSVIQFESGGVTAVAGGDGGEHHRHRRPPSQPGRERRIAGGIPQDSGRDAGAGPSSPLVARLKRCGPLSEVHRGVPRHFREEASTDGLRHDILPFTSHMR